MPTPDRALVEVVRVEGGRVLATLTRHLGDLDLAEDAVQDAVVRALERWPRDGVPDNPAAWLTTTARHAALDRVRREAKRGPKEEAAMTVHDGPAEVPEPSMVRDDQLRLLFTCCHPAIAPDARVALALRTLCGLTTEEIAAAFLVPTSTMAQRLVRAKKKIARARIPYRVPPDHELPDRLDAVLAVVYVVFTEAHNATSGDDVVRTDLAEEAIRLARLLVELMPDVPECQGLLALLLATHARRASRLDDAGELVLLADQDRTAWDHAAIAEADALVRTALGRRTPGPYQVQAAIACCHGTAATAGATDWPQIAELYGVLETLRPDPVVRLNRAVAVAEASGAAAGLAVVDGIEGLDRWHRYHAVRGELLHRLGRAAEAEVAFRAALAGDPSPAEARHLEGRLAAGGRQVPRSGEGE